jgi:hypothetical protein
MNLKNFERDRVLFANTMIKMAKIIASLETTAGPTQQQAMENDPKIGEFRKKGGEMMELLNKTKTSLERHLSEFEREYGAHVKQGLGVDFSPIKKAFTDGLAALVKGFGDQLRGAPIGGPAPSAPKAEKPKFRENIELPQ